MFSHFYQIVGSIQTAILDIHKLHSCLPPPNGMSTYHIFISKWSKSCLFNYLQFALQLNYNELHKTYSAYGAKRCFVLAFGLWWLLYCSYSNWRSLCNTLSPRFSRPNTWQWFHPLHNSKDLLECTIVITSPEQQWLYSLKYRLVNGPTDD